MRIPVKGADEFRPEAKESNHLRTDTRLDRPFGPILHVHFEFKMHEPVPQAV